MVGTSSGNPGRRPAREHDRGLGRGARVSDAQTLMLVRIAALSPSILPPASYLMASAGAVDAGLDAVRPRVPTVIALIVGAPRDASATGNIVVEAPRSRSRSRS